MKITTETLLANPRFKVAFDAHESAVKASREAYDIRKNAEKGLPLDMSLPEGDTGAQLTDYLKTYGVVGAEAEKIRGNRVIANRTGKAASHAGVVLEEVREAVIREWFAAGKVTRKEAQAAGICGSGI
jgi:hypothetical protein